MSVNSCYIVKLLIVCSLLLSSYTDALCNTPETVRVRILENHKPEKISLININNSEIKIIIDKNSIFPIQITESEQYFLSLPDSSLKRIYAGRLDIQRQGEALVVINVVSLEDYVQSVVLSEMGMQSIEAMRAQAVLSRTWAITQVRPHKSYDFNDLTASQVYKGVFTSITLKPGLLLPTAGKILTYNNQAIKVFYHASCAGRRYSAHEIWGQKSYPYYVKKDFPDHLKLAKPERWQRKIYRNKIDRIFTEVNDKLTENQYIKTHNKGQAGVYINDVWYGIDKFRLKINRKLGWNQLRSNEFSLQVKDNYLIFEGSGFGHLVGLCQKSAVELAKQGWKYSEILQLFYPGTEISF